MATINHNNEGGSAAKCVKTKLEIERRDLLKLAALVVTVIGLIVGPGFGLLFKIFQTREQAVIDHAKTNQEAALLKQESQLRYEFSQDKTKDIKDNIAELGKGLKAVQEMAKALHDNQELILEIEDVPRWKRKALPAKVEFDFKDVDSP